MSRSASFRCAVMLAFAAVLACGQPAPEDGSEVPVVVEHVGIDRNAAPVVVLQEHDGHRQLPIWIGASQARSIATIIEKRSEPRPNTHDLARDVIQGLDAEVIRVVVTELRAGTYYAVLSLRVGNRRVDLDSRPSDGIAIALRTDAPIFVRAQLFEEQGQAGEETKPDTGLSI